MVKVVEVGKVGKQSGGVVYGEDGSRGREDHLNSGIEFTFRAEVGLRIRTMCRKFTRSCQMALPSLITNPIGDTFILHNTSTYIPYYINYCICTCTSVLLNPRLP